MLVGMDMILRKARSEGYGVAAPNAFNLETLHTCFMVASEMKSPLIIGYHAPGDEGIMMEIGMLARFYAGKYPDVPIALNLDHGRTFADAVRAVRAGFTSVMIDSSEQSLEDNILRTSEVCKMAHAVGVSVEAELGHVGRGVQYAEDRNVGLTRVEEVVHFVEKTEVDCLAVAIGTAHGRYVGTPSIDFQRLEVINRVSPVPLVLHGGSSTGDENLKEAIELGISKVNLFTDLSNSGVDSVQEYLSTEAYPSLTNIHASGVTGYKEMLRHYIELFGSAGKGK